MTEDAHRLGIKVMALCGNVKQARVLAASGVDVVPFPVQFERVGKPAAIRAREDGDIENGSAACGQSAGLIRDIRPAGELIATLVDEASAVLARLPG